MSVRRVLNRAGIEKGRAKDMEMARRALLIRKGPIPEMACYHSPAVRRKVPQRLSSSPKIIEFQLYVHDLVLSHAANACATSNRPSPSWNRLHEILWAKYGAGVRYPMENFVDPDEEEAWEAIKLAEEVATFVKS